MRRGSGVPRKRRTSSGSSRATSPRPTSGAEVFLASRCPRRVCGPVWRTWRRADWSTTCCAWRRRSAPSSSFSRMSRGSCRSIAVETSTASSTRWLRQATSWTWMNSMRDSSGFHSAGDGYSSYAYAPILDSSGGRISAKACAWRSCPRTCSTPWAFCPFGSAQDVQARHLLVQEVSLVFGGGCSPARTRRQTSCGEDLRAPWTWRQGRALPGRQTRHQFASRLDDSARVPRKAGRWRQVRPAAAHALGAYRSCGTISGEKARRWRGGAPHRRNQDEQRSRESSPVSRSRSPHASASKPGAVAAAIARARPHRFRPCYGPVSTC